MAASPPSALEALPSLPLDRIIALSGARAAAALSCCSARLQRAAGDDAVWRSFFAADFWGAAIPDDEQPVDPEGIPCYSFRKAYQLFFKSFGMYPFPLIRRVRKFWSSMKGWLAANYPEALVTLNKGASEAQLNSAEDALGLKLPMPTRMLYRFCNGQLPISKSDSTNAALAPFGIIGGYAFYDYTVNVHLSPIEQIVRQTKDFVDDFPFANSENIVVAESWFMYKMFFLNCSSGQLYVGTQNLVVDGEMMPCVPQSLVRLRTNSTEDSLQDGLLLWLEEHLRRLENKIIGTRVVRNARTISLYPESSHLCSSCITNGIKVRASAVYVPELSEAGGGNRRHYYSYSIRMSLLPDGCMLDGVFYSSCQLYSRHWLIHSGDRIVSNVKGEAVIGQYPYLQPGEEEFVYESCTPLPEAPGSVEGSFTFIPGRISRPEGRSFDVEVAPFPLEYPDYIF